MYDIAEILRSLLDRHSRASEAEQQFARMLDDDEQLKNDYREWCEEQDIDFKTGYRDFLDELIESRDSIWENLNE